MTHQCRFWVAERRKDESIAAFGRRLLGLYQRVNPTGWKIGRRQAHAELLPIAEGD